ncbi:hypothetical protein ACHAW5_005150 [Stephanodiscus triporus]|uniref:Uncharacterized protein n=1 Tax=Stephanodiscus triporus TaxID=2934178 RepID=A0ABD3N0A0_9STRA
MAGPKGGKRKKDARPSPGADAGAAGDAGGGGEGCGPTRGFSALLRNLSSSMGINRELDDMTLSEVLAAHPLIRVGKFVIVPYVLYLSNFYLRLHHPEYVSAATGGMVNLRPAVHGTDVPRQVLIVATPGSDTARTSAELRGKLSLEIGHDTADVAWDFNRDGSISWLHGIRFLTRPADDGEKVRAVARICNGGIDAHARMGFHPASFGPTRLNCSRRRMWDECWKSECFLALLDEWGCGIASGDGRKKCKVDFARTLHQVRNPMHTLEDLVATHCVGGLEGVAAEPFLEYASALFPGHDFYGDSCIEATGTFMVSYLEAMIEARLRGDIDAFYSIEKSSACDVAEAAGLSSADTTVYEPNHVRISRRCDGGDNEASPSRTIVETKSNEANLSHLKLGWNDLRGGMHGSTRAKGDMTLQGKVKKMFMAFMYDEKTIPLQYEPSVQRDSKSEL